MGALEWNTQLSVAIRGERGSYNCFPYVVPGAGECSYPG